MHADLETVREQLSRLQPHWAVTEIQGERAQVAAAPALLELYALLDAQFHESWGLSWQLDSRAPYAVRCRLELLGSSREGLAESPTLVSAQLLAAAEAARAWGLLGAEPARHWVEYDPEEGPNTDELTPDEGSATAPSAPPAQQELDPQLMRARKHIDELMETLKAAGLGREAARIVLRGYGNTLEESRDVYKQLKALQSGH